MNVYDFDGTLYRGDSSLDYILFCMGKRPALLRFLPRFLWVGLRYRLGLCEKTEMKERFCSFLKVMPAEESTVTDFWETHRKKLCSWYGEKHSPDDVILSASPEFLLVPIGRKLGVSAVIGSRVDPRSGRFSGKNCHGTEKVRRWREAFGEVSPSCFFSDSLSDLPMADIAERAVLVRNRRRRQNIFQPFPHKKSDPT